MRRPIILIPTLITHMSADSRWHSFLFSAKNVVVRLMPPSLHKAPRIHGNAGSISQVQQPLNPTDHKTPHTAPQLHPPPPPALIQQSNSQMRTAGASTVECSLPAITHPPSLCTGQEELAYQAQETLGLHVSII
jgi:hypothetical protein